MQKMDKAALKARVCEIIRERNAEIVELGRSIFAEPELGFKEVKTSAKIKAAFEKLVSNAKRAGASRASKRA